METSRQRPHHTEVDIMIVGSGPAGLSTWLHLRALAPQLAASAIVIEKSRHPREKLCGGAITPLGHRLLEGLRITLDVGEVAVDTIELRFAERRHEFQRPAALRIVHRAEFDAALAATATKRGLQLHEDEAFESASPTDDGLRITTTRGAYRVRALVGADGVFSRVRQSIGFEGESRMARLLEIVRPCDHRDSEFQNRSAVFDFSPASDGLQGYVWHFPCLRTGVPSMNHGVFDARVHSERTRVDLRATLEASLRDRGISADASWQSQPVRWLADVEGLSKPHAFLIGDAAGVDAALGEGIAQSLDYGDLAANVLIDAFRRNDFTFARYATQLSRHPVGSALAARRRLATAAYEDGATPASIERALMLWVQSNGA